MNIEKETINFDEETMSDLWNGLYFKGSSIKIMDETYKHVDQINTSQFSDGESWDFIVQRESDGKYFKFHVWDSGNGYVFSYGHNSLTEVFPKKEIKTVYE